MADKYNNADMFLLFIQCIITTDICLMKPIIYISFGNVDEFSHFPHFKCVSTLATRLQQKHLRCILTCALS